MWSREQECHELTSLRLRPAWSVLYLTAQRRILENPATLFPIALTAVLDPQFTLANRMTAVTDENTPNLAFKVIPVAAFAAGTL